MMGHARSNNRLKADVEGWYQTTLGAAGWRRVVCRPGGCPDDFVLVLIRGSRECLNVLVTIDGAGEILIDYQITPSAKPLSGDPTADHRYCTGQYAVLGKGQSRRSISVHHGLSVHQLSKAPC